MVYRKMRRILTIRMACGVNRVRVTDQGLGKTRTDPWHGLRQRPFLLQQLFLLRLRLLRLLRMLRLLRLPRDGLSYPIPWHALGHTR